MKNLIQTALVTLFVTSAAQAQQAVQALLAAALAHDSGRFADY
jgi:hypothetical protein